MLSQKLKKKIFIKKDFYIRLVKSNKYSKILFKLRNDHVDKKHTLAKKKIKHSDHYIWYKKFLKKKNFIFLIFKKKAVLGYLRLENEHKLIKARKDFFLSIFIKKKYRDQNIGSLILKKISLLFYKNNIISYVNRENKLSIFFFKKNGYKEKNKQKKLVLI
jgi:L-amino acid N-acyltransferase YncA